MEEQIKTIQKEYLEKVNQAGSLKEADEIFLELFGKNGKFTELSKKFSTLPKEEVKIVAPVFSQVKEELEKLINVKREDIREGDYKKLEEEELDLTFVVSTNVSKEYKSRDFSPAEPDRNDKGEDQSENEEDRNGKGVGLGKRVGRLHPISEFEDKIASLFKELGFQQFDGPHIDTDEYNFGLLNIPAEHPARDMWDTLYIDGEKYGFKKGELLLRTHTSDAQPHIIKSFKPPFRMMIIGRCFRYENLDARHEHTFDQFEIVYVDKGLSLANLQYLSEYFFKAMLGEDIKVRLSPGYYPFTEPSAHIFGSCIFCKGQGCKICGETGELELAGAGMIHPNVLRVNGIDPEEYSGIAWGVGPARMAMLKYDVPDLRLFNSGDLKFLKGLKDEGS